MNFLSSDSPKRWASFAAAFNTGRSRRRTLASCGAELEEIEKTIQQMESLMQSGERSRSADLSFHVQLARTSGNDVLAAIAGNRWEGMLSPLFSRMSERIRLVSREQQAVAEHRALFAAISTRVALSARTAMRQHL